MMENPNEQQPRHDEIARAAYQIWEQRARPHGYDVEFWLEAERQLRSARQPSRDESIAAAASQAGRQAPAKPGRNDQPKALPAKASRPRLTAARASQRPQSRAEIA